MSELDIILLSMALASGGTCIACFLSARDVAAKNARLHDENAKLRNEVDNLLDFEHLTSVAVAYAGCDECGEYKQTMLRLFAENAKLRELVQYIYDECYGDDWFNEQADALGFEPHF